MSNETPQSAEAEAALLRSVIADPGRIRVLGLEADDFWRPSHRRIWEACVALSDDGVVLDKVTIQEHIERQGEWNGATETALYSRIVNGEPDPLAAEHYAAILQKLTSDRRMLTACDLMQTAINEHEDRTDATTAIQDALQPKAARVVTPQERHHRYMKTYEERTPPFLPVPLLKWTNQSGGIFAAGQTVVGARPNVGKTAFALYMALHLARLNYPVLILSLESSAQELYSRLIAQASFMENGFDGFRLTDIRNRDVDPAVVHQWSEWISKLPLWIEDRFTSLARLDSFTRAMCYQHKLAAVFMDHIGKVSDREIRGESRERQTIGAASKAFYRISKDCNVSTVLLAHLNRQAEGAMMPTLAHLRMSGDLENDADEVIMLSREDKSTNWGQFTLRKAREGRADEGFKYAFIQDYVSFKNYSDQEEEDD